MVFRRRDRRPAWRVAAEVAYPRGGWGRALAYVRHRLRRLPDSPEKIARGVAAGVFTAFTPFYFVHFVVAFLVARAVRGNVLAALIGTFANNPLTIVPISAAAMGVGYLVLGLRPDEGLIRGLGHLFGDAAGDLWHNALAPFTPALARWEGLAHFWQRVFLPYLVGGLVPGLLAGLAAYGLTLPLARAYQAGRRRALEERLASLKAPPPEPAPPGPQP